MASSSSPARRLLIKPECMSGDLAAVVVLFLVLVVLSKLMTEFLPAWLLLHPLRSGAHVGGCPTYCNASYVVNSPYVVHTQKVIVLILWQRVERLIALLHRALFPLCGPLTTTLLPRRWSSDPLRAAVAAVIRDKVSRQFLVPGREADRN